MISDSTNPFASPKADIEATTAPEADQAFPFQATAVAQIEEVPQPYAGTVRTLSARLLNGLANFGTTLLVIVPFYGLLAFGPEAMDLSGWTTVALFVIGIAAQFILFRVTSVFFKDRWWERVVRQQFHARPAPWIESSSYRSEYVTLTSTQPKAMSSFQLGSNEAEIMDVGLIELDEIAGSILLECENRRYRIPRASLLACDLQQITLGTPWTPVVRIVCQSHEGPCEFCLLPGDTDLRQIFTFKSRKKRAEILARDILDLPSKSPESST